MTRERRQEKGPEAGDKETRDSRQDKRQKLRDRRLYTGDVRQDTLDRRQEK